MEREEEEERSEQKKKEEKKTEQTYMHVASCELRVASCGDENNKMSRSDRIEVPESFFWFYRSSRTCIVCVRCAVLVRSSCLY